MNHTSRRSTWAAATALALLASAATLPASARQVAEEVPWVAGASSVSLDDGSGNCPLRRLGTQLVRCDHLTGAGVAAPTWIPAY